MTTDDDRGVHADTSGHHDPWQDDPRLPEVFGPAWPAVSGFHAMLAQDGVLRGLVGPREVSRLWERHLLNSAAVVPLLPESGMIVDLGSGAGLPGVVVAAMRPEAEVVLLEPMQRRTDWLAEVVARLGLDNARVLRGRAEDVAGSVRADAVTARAVAGLDKLLGWAVPLLVPGGTMVALKGERAADEVAGARRVAQRLGVVETEVLRVRPFGIADETTVVRARLRG